MNHIRAVTFATSRFVRAAKVATESLASSGVLDTTIVTPETFYSFIKNYDLDSNVDIDFSSRGAGYWRWKPLLILSMLTSTNEGDGVLYFDSRVFFKQKYISYLDQHSNGQILVFENIQKKNSIDLWTDSKVLSHIDKSGLVGKQGLLLAGVIYVPKNKQNIEIMEQWNELCSNDLFLSPDEKKDYRPENPCVWHRHDQSLLSILARQNMNCIQVIPYYVGLKGVIANLVIFHRNLNCLSPICIYCLHLLRALRRSIVDSLPKNLRMVLRNIRTKGTVSDLERERHKLFF